MQIAVLLTCFNRRESTLKCLRTLYEQALPDGVVLEVFLVDDGCTDGTGDAVREQFPKIHVLQGDGTLYWCSGMRFAWAEAMKEGYDAYLWLNDDTMLLPGAMKTLLAAAHEVHKKEGREGIVVGSCRDPKTRKHTYGGRVKRNRHTRIPDQLLPPGDHILPCDTMNGNLVLVPKQVVDVLGNMSPEFTHMGFSDVDYGGRARKLAIPVCVAPGYLAECSANTQVPPWTDPKVPLKERWHNMCAPGGLPPRQWLVYVRRHTGAAWPIYFIKPLIRVMFPQLWLWK